ncbi:hypothetical protein KILIM_096_00040 [Kineosphaera limosa NBRC 100340]|uniref:DUF3352 domain-containing protein n=1 Tax=Kineosphaera limosa NBRC 100340 TaxID=1184609 RepID=K6XGR9_9MICO|nr:hypothetical protein KILIM_096_00040 [Kineosphaera limosa NBRC 100340]
MRSGDGDLADATSSRKRRRTVVAGSAAAALVVAGGAAAIAGSGMLGGGGSQPEDVLPGESIVFVKVDLDPGVAQKVGAFRLMDKLPQAKEALNSGDPKKALFEWISANDKDVKVDYAADVEPWLGDRVGMAILAPQGSSTEPVPVVAVQVKDEAKAREGIAKLEAQSKDAIAGAKDTAAKAMESATGPGASPSAGAKSDSEPVQIFRNGYLVVTDAANEQRVTSAMDAGALSANDTFKADMSALGEKGVASGWVDGPKSMSLQGGSSTPAAMEELAALGGRSAFALRFSADYLEFAQVNRDVKLSTQAPALKDVANLPATTGAFYSFSGGSAYLGELWPTITKFAAAAVGPGADFEAQLKEIEQQTGLVLPQDLQTLLGEQFDVVVPKQDFKDAQGMPQVGMRLWGDTAKSEAVLKKITDLANEQGAMLPIQTQTSDGHFDISLLGGSFAALASVADSGQSVSAAPGFAKVLPDLAKANSALYVDLDAFESQYLPEVPAEHRELVQALQAVGMTAQPITNGEQHSTLRVSVN